MGKIRFALIGTGWRAEFYIRIAKALPDLFELTQVLVRDPQKGEAFSKKFGVCVVNHLEQLLASKPDFVVLAIRRGTVAGYLVELFKLGVPVLSETPPGENMEDLISLWTAAKRYSARVQIAEQYFAQPYYAAWYETIKNGMIGEVENISLSSLHGYHGVSIIRRMLGVGFENCTVWGKRYQFAVTDTYGREGMCFDGNKFSCPRDRFTFEFENGKTAFFDFSDPAQYHSFIRTRQMNIQGVRGEIDDFTIRYLADGNIPVKQDLNRIDLGVYGNQEWSHFAIMLGEKFLYRTPFPNARFNYDEIAVATLLLDMKKYLETGEDVYSLADALQDMYLCLQMDSAAQTPYQPVKSVSQPWSE